MANHSGPLTRRERTWMIMFITALSSTFVFGWVFSAILQAILSGCPLSDHHYCSSEWQTTMAILWPVFLAFFVVSLIYLFVVLVLRVTPWYTHGVDAKSRIRSAPPANRKGVWVIMLLSGIASTVVWVALTVVFLFGNHHGLWEVFCALTGVSVIYTFVVSILRCTPWYKQGVAPVAKDIEENDEAPHYEDVVEQRSEERNEERVPTPVVEYHHDIVKN